MNSVVFIANRILEKKVRKITLQNLIKIPNSLKKLCKNKQLLEPPATKN